MQARYRQAINSTAREIFKAHPNKFKCLTKFSASASLID